MVENQRNLCRLFYLDNSIFFASNIKCLVIQKLAEILKNCRDESKFFIKSVIPITQAKVPIVKFEYVFNKVEYEGDISYYNILGKKK